MFKRICGLALACGLLAACSGTGQQSVVPQTTTLTDPQLGSTPAAATSTSASTGSAISTMSATSTPIKHVTVVLLENYNYSQIIGNASAPYINSFANANALFTNSHGVSHPSEPNYDALFSGSTQGLTSDACPVSYSAANLATELSAKGYSFAGYAENWPGTSACAAAPSSSVGSAFLYWRKHAPWVNYSNVPLSVGHNYNGPGTPLTGTVNFVVPNICNDMHDCSPATGDAWLSKNLPAIESYDNANNGLLIVTFDEGDNDPNNHIVTIMSGPMVKSGTYTQSINHYNVLRLIEDNFGLPLLGASASATPISGVISGGTTSTPSPAPSPNATATPLPKTTPTPAPATGGTSVNGEITYTKFFASTGEFYIQTVSGTHTWVYTTPSTHWIKNGLTVKNGDYVSMTGTWSRNAYDANSVTLKSSP